MTADLTESFARPRVASGALFFDHLGRVLMVVPTYKDYLETSGGYMERGKVFGSGSRSMVAILILVRDGSRSGGCDLLYRDIGDYLTRE